MEKCRRIEVVTDGPTTLSEMEIILTALRKVNHMMSGKEGIDKLDLERQAIAIINKDWSDKLYTGRMMRRTCTWVIILTTGVIPKNKDCQKLDGGKNE